MANSFLESKGFKSFMGKAYGLGAAVVIVGALFKITHWKGADLMLTIGLLTEAAIFTISAFEKPHQEPDWTLVYPELSGLDPKETKKSVKGGLGVTQQLDKMLEDAKIGPDLINSLGNGFRSLNENVIGLKDLSSAGSKEYAGQVERMTKNLSSLNSVYELEITESNNHLKSINEFVGGLSKTVNTLNETNAQAETFKTEMDKLSKNLTSLNNVYGNMLSAMNVKG
jgi:archaellum component FlaC